MSIEAGDMVVVVGCSCVCTAEDIGSFGVVKNVLQTDARCHVCGFDDGPVVRARFVSNHGGVSYKPLSWLKKIPPLSELEGKERERELVLK
jgi:hypothetical protein